jgi:hypothetical protein
MVTEDVVGRLADVGRRVVERDFEEGLISFWIYRRWKHWVFDYGPVHGFISIRIPFV